LDVRHRANIVAVAGENSKRIGVDELISEVMRAIQNKQNGEHRQHHQRSKKDGEKTDSPFMQR